MDFNTKPKTVEAMGTGVSKKKTHIFSGYRICIFISAIVKEPDTKNSSHEATVNETEAVLHLLRWVVSTAFVGFLYIKE